MPATDDWAVVVGINCYPDPGIGHLRGPETDALKFYEWLTTVEGIPIQNPDNHRSNLVPGEKQAKLILSSHFGPPANDAIDAQPTVEAVSKVFDKLDVIAQANSNEGRGRRVGRRLYLYFAGHGCEPVAEEVVLLMANATLQRPNHHIPGRVVANAFYRGGYFDEVILIMDCCRGRYPAARLNVPPFVEIIDPDAPQRGKRFYGFATKWSRKSREREFGGTTRGVFSMALMDALNGAAAEPDGSVTSSSLAGWLYNNMKTYLEPIDQDNPEIPKEPDLQWDPHTEFVISRVTPKRYPVTLRFPSNWQGETAKILSGLDFGQIATTTLNGNSWAIELPTGSYLASVSNGRTQVATVNGKGAVDVTFY